MNWQIARVTDRDGDRLTLVFSPISNCSRCARGEGCGAGVFAGLFRRADRPLVIAAPADVSEGDWVRVGVGQRTLLTSALVHYGIPLAAFLIGAAAGHALADGAAGRDFAALAAGLAAFALSLRALRARPMLAVNPVVERLSCMSDDSNSSGRPFA
ncbi:MAG: hypothetical protein GVY32_04525 [Gammaproteobacteria bacterium]|jgi:sigma-E factor negative regulatory protein RseC|nr:hypothetical protein [Gammaproteobacteria bacterium]